MLIRKKEQQLRHKMVFLIKESHKQVPWAVANQGCLGRGQQARHQVQNFRPFLVSCTFYGVLPLQGEKGECQLNAW